MDHLGLLLDISEINLALFESASIKSFLNNCVELVAKHLDANVCSIYLFDQGDEKLTLRATQGLNPELVGKVTLKLGEGLTGIALQELRSINVRESSKQPGYKFVPGLFEERFDAFCAVPIMRGIQRIGVLVVQRERTEPFSENDERSLRGVANQLASIIEYSRILVSKPALAPAQAGNKTLKFVKGKSASIGFAHAPLVIDRKIRSLKDLEKDVSTWTCTRADFTAALENLTTQLSSFQKRIEEQLADAASLIFAAHLMVLKDEQFVGKIRRLIDNGLNPGMAIIEITEEYCALLDRSPTVYLREKSDDIRDLGVRLLGFLRQGEPSAEDLSGKIVVARDVLISDILIMSARGVAGIVLVGGGVSSHLSILARSCKIPLMIAEEEGLLDLAAGTMALLDADLGNLYIDPAPRSSVRLRPVTGPAPPRFWPWPRKPPLPPRPPTGAAFSLWQMSIWLPTPVTPATSAPMASGSTAPNFPLSFARIFLPRRNSYIFIKSSSRGFPARKSRFARSTWGATRSFRIITHSRSKTLFSG